MHTAINAAFDQRYQTHLKHLKLKGLQPKTIDAYAPSAESATTSIGRLTILPSRN